MKKTKRKNIMKTGIDIDEYKMKIIRKNPKTIIFSSQVDFK